MLGMLSGLEYGAADTIGQWNGYNAEDASQSDASDVVIASALSAGSTDPVVRMLTPIQPLGPE